jgi:hypothetical protein
VRVAAALSSRRAAFDAAASVALVLGSGIGAVVQGQDSNTDLYRYHLYIGYAFLHGRLDYDLAPASLGTYLNPVLDAFHYLGIAHLPPLAFGFLLGCLQGLNAVVALLVARRLLGAGSLLPILCGVLAASGPTARSLLGTTIGDTTVSLPALLALLLVLPGPAGQQGAGLAWRMLAAGCLTGAAMGLKLTMATALGGLGAVVALGVGRKQVPLGAAAACFAGVGLGYSAVAGYWCWRMWERFANPIFPFANQIFRSPYLPAEAIWDTRWAARGAFAYLSAPIEMALGTTERLQEIPFRDARLLLVLGAAIVWSGLRLVRRCGALSHGEQSLLGYLAVSYVLWVGTFYYYRYAAAVEFLAPVAFVTLVRAALPHIVRPVAVAASILVVLTSSVGSWGRLGWDQRWSDVRLPPQAHETNSLVLLDSSLSSFLIPYFPQEVRFAGLEGTGSARIEALLSAEIAAHRGSLFWLASRRRPEESSRPDRFGVTVTDDCGVVRTGAGRWSLCRVVPRAGPRG